MAKQSNQWQTISLTPLSGMLDTRSRPADIPAGAFRYKLNWAVTPEAKLCRRSGFQKFTLESQSFVNEDFHHQGQTVREPVTMQFESTSPSGERRYFLGTQSGIWRLHPETGTYEQIVTGKGAAGTRWHAAELQGVLLFVNNHDNVLYYNPDWAFGTQAPALGSLVNGTGANGLNVSTAAVVISWNGVMIVMNVVQDGQRQSSRIIWSDLNLPENFFPSAAGIGPTDAGYSIAGFQDLNYGDDILAAAPLLGALYIFTRRSIWKMVPSGDTSSVFAFAQVYSEPKNQTGCIAFPNTLVSTGQDFFYMGRDGIYRYNPYIPVPERDEWLHRADGLIYRALPTQLDGNYCLSPVAEYMPTNREVWFSWPGVDISLTSRAGINNYTLVAQVEQKTADIVDHGFTSLVNFRKTPSGVQACNEAQFFLGASGTDWTIKDIGGVFYREVYAAAVDAEGLPTPDIAESAEPVQIGYNSILRGMIPLGLNDREKKVRSVLIDHDTSEQDTPCAVQLRIGNSFSLVDPNDPEVLPVVIASARCAPLWRIIKDATTGLLYKLLRCPDQMTIAEMQAKNLRANLGMQWFMYETGRFLWYEITIQNADGTPAIGGDSCFQRVDFEALAMPKP